MAAPSNCDNLPHSCLLSIVLQSNTYGLIFSAFGDHHYQDSTTQKGGETMREVFLKMPI